MHRAVLGFLLFAGLPAAHGQEPGGGVPAAGVRPGLWETAISLIDLQLEGLPPEVAEQVRREGVRTVESQCYSEADAADPVERLMSGLDCTYGQRTFSGGTVDVAGTCRGPAGEDLRIVLTGTYTADRITA